MPGLHPLSVAAAGSLAGARMDDTAGATARPAVGDKPTPSTTTSRAHASSTAGIAAATTAATGRPTTRTTTTRARAPSGPAQPPKSAAPPRTSTATASSQPTGPVLVNPAAPSSTPPAAIATATTAMPFVRPLPFRGGGGRRPAPGASAVAAAAAAGATSAGSHTGTSVVEPPAPHAFAFASIFAAVTADAAAQADLDAIAAICGRSRLSLANEYAAHRRPVGELHGPPAELATVEERSLAGDEAVAAGADGAVDGAVDGLHGVAGAGTTQGASSPAASPPFVGLWERGGGRAPGHRPTGRSVVGLSGGASRSSWNARAGFDRRSVAGSSVGPAVYDGRAAPWTAGPTGDGQALRQLMRVSGGG